jgi:lipoyl(octanoyl) transferase|tara:strand:- start:342 stop:953 length:612 start_codon:yes stop_codon:yes gene_type:complete
MSIEIKLSKKPIPYQKAMLLLDKRVEEVKKGDNKELVWILEHPKTYTAGVSFKKSEIIDHKIEVVKTNRGGKITLHNPGQKLIYFVINLNNRKKDIRKLINTIETSIIEFLYILKIEGKKDKKNIGIWVKGKKIAAIGLRVSRWVAFHGCSINISNNLKEYLKILPCGLDNTKITSVLSEKNIIPKNFEKKLINIFIKNIKKI